MAKIRLIPKTDDARVESGELAHVSELKGYMVADPSPDPTGWPIKLRDGRSLGTVDDLVANTSDLVVQYVEVKLSREFRPHDDDEYVLIPTHAIRFDEAHGTVIVDRVPTVELSQLPRVRRADAPRRAPTAAEVQSAAEIFEVQVPEDSDIIEQVIENRPLQ